MASYDEARRAGYNGDYGAGHQGQMGFHQGVEEREKDTKSGKYPGINPLGVFVLFALACACVALFYALICSVVAALVIAGLTQAFFLAPRKRESLRVTYGASYATFYSASVWGEFAWALFTWPIVGAASVLDIEPFSGAAKGVIFWVQRLVFWNHQGHDPLLEGFSWPGPQLVLGLLALFGPGILAHAIVLCRKLKEPYAGSIGFVRAVGVSGFAVVTSFVSMAAVFSIISAAAFTLKEATFPPWVFRYCEVGLFLATVVGTTAGALLARVLPGSRDASLRRLVLWTFLGVAGHLVLSGAVLLAYAQLTRFYPLTNVLAMAFTQPLPWHYVMGREHTLAEVRPLLLASQVPGGLLLVLTSWVSLRVASGRIWDLWRPLVLALVLVVVSVASAALVFGHLPTAFFVD